MWHNSAVIQKSDLILVKFCWKTTVLSRIMVKFSIVIQNSSLVLYVLYRTLMNIIDCVYSRFLKFCLWWILQLASQRPDFLIFEIVLIDPDFGEWFWYFLFFNTFIKTIENQENQDCPQKGNDFVGFQNVKKSGRCEACSSGKWDRVRSKIEVNSARFLICASSYKKKTTISALIM